MRSLGIGFNFKHSAGKILLPLLIFIISFVANCLVSNFVFESVPHLEDEVSFVFQAKTLASGRLFVDIPEHQEFFDLPFLVKHDGKMFGKYPPGHPIILTIGMWLGCAWIINPFFSSLALVFIYLIGRKVYDQKTAILAAFLAFFSPFFLLQSATFLSHPTTLFFIVIFIYLYILAKEKKSLKLFFLAGAAMGFPFLSRQLTALSLAMPFVMVELFLLLRYRRNIVSVLAMIAGFLPWVLLLLLYNQILTGNPLTNPYELYWPYDKVGFGEGIGSQGSHTWDEAVLNTNLNLEYLRDYLFGWPLDWDIVPAIIAFVGFIISLFALAVSFFAKKLLIVDDRLKKEILWDFIFLTMIFSIIIAHMFYWASGRMYGPRYYFEAMPAFLLLSARGLILLANSGAYLCRIIDFFRQFFAGKNPNLTSYPFEHGSVSNKEGSFFRRNFNCRGIFPRLSLLATALLLCILISFNLTGFMPETFKTYYRWYDVNGQIQHKAASMDLGEAIVFVPFGKGWTDWANLLLLNSPTFDSATIFAIDRGSYHNQKLIDKYPQKKVLYWQDIAE